MHTPVVFIDGDQGTTGLQIHARLQGRGDLRLLTLPEAERKTRNAAARRSTAPTSRCCACPTMPHVRPWQQSATHTCG
jgi:N-acetyl-gamma-glutamyl-phosphate reductase